jgi:hypothetical protein
MQRCVTDELPRVEATVDAPCAPRAERDGPRVPTPPDRETVHTAAAELLDPVLLAAGFARAAPGHWSGTRFPWHEDVIMEVEAPAGPGAVAFSLEIYAGVPRHGIGDPARSRAFVRALDRCAVDAMQGLRRSDRWMIADDPAELRAWLRFVVEHLPAAITRVREHG